MEWIKLCKDTHRKPEIAIVAEILGKSNDEVFGMAMRLFCWLDDTTANGFLPNMTLERLASASSIPHDFLVALACDEVRWLLPVRRDGDSSVWGIQVPNWDRHNGQCAKKRADAARRVAKCRAKKR